MLRTGDATALDLSGAWLLHRLRPARAAAGATLRWEDGEPEPVKLVDQTLGADEDDVAAVEAARRAATPQPLPIAALGRDVIDRAREMRRGLEFIGETNERLFAAMTAAAPVAADLDRPARLRHRHHRDPDRRR